MAPPRTAGDAAVRLRADAENASAALPALLLAAGRLAATVDAGAHGLRRPGAGEAFWQYRPAAAGDPAGSIDWRRSARSDTAFVRERERQSPQAAAIWVAGGTGMDWTGDAARPPKRERARLIALALGLALLRGGERVAIGAAEARSGRLQSEALARDLIGVGTGTRPDQLDDPPEAMARPGRRLVLIGDFLGDLAGTGRLVARAADLGCGGALLQVLDPAEEAFPFVGAIRFRAPGGPSHETRDAGALRPAYLRRLAERRAALSALASGAGWRFGTHDTGRPAAEALLWLSQVLAA